MTALAIKAMFLVHWFVVLFTRVRGLVSWFWLLGLTPIFNGEEMGADGQY